MPDFQGNSTSPTACEAVAEMYASSESSGSVDDATRTTTVHRNHYPKTPPDALPGFIPVGGAAVNTAPACGAFSVPPTSYFGFYPSRTSSSPTRSTRSRSQSRPRQKSITYKSTFSPPSELLCEGSNEVVQQSLASFTSQTVRVRKVNSVHCESSRRPTMLARCDSFLLCYGEAFTTRM
jgi:hypothetical protein